MNNSYQHDTNDEIDGLKLLIANFGINGTKVDDPVKTISDRYKILVARSNSVLGEDKQKPDEYYNFCLKAHRYLYYDILKNAGQFRNASDPNGGNVYFGGTYNKTMKSKFMGTDPRFICSELETAFSILFNSSYQPGESAIRFYAEFVAVHPFYDANGRIARYMVDAFLKFHNLYVNWNLLNERHGKFLRKINYCHSVREKEKLYLSCASQDEYCSAEKKRWVNIRNTYIDYLFDFWKLFLNEIPLQEDA